MAKRNYDEEFKRDAVELLLSGAQGLKPLARDLGICPATLRGWTRGHAWTGVDAYGPPTVARREIVGRMDRVDRVNGDPIASAAPRLVSPSARKGLRPAQPSAVPRLVSLAGGAKMHA